MDGNGQHRSAQASNWQSSRAGSAAPGANVGRRPRGGGGSVSLLVSDPREPLVAAEVPAAGLEQTVLLLQRLAGNAAVRTLLESLAAADAPAAGAEREAENAAHGRTAIGGRAPPPTIFRQAERDLRKLEPYFPYQLSEYFVRFSEEIKRDLQAEMRQVALPTGSRYVSWADGSEARFVAAVLNILSANTGKQFEADLYRYLPPAAVSEAVKRGREVGEIETKWFGGKDYFPAVALELRTLLTSQIAASLPRIAPRYLFARNQAALTQQLPTKRAVAAPPEPDPANIVASTSIDKLVIPALLAGTVTVDLAAYRAANPAERRSHEVRQLRAIAEGDWRFEAVQGLWSWIRVLRPADATVEEVARLLYGDETQSRRIVPAPPLFGFDPDRLSGRILKRWEAVAGADEDDIQYRVLKDVPPPKPGERETTLQHGYDPARGAAVELLYSAQADEVTMIQARGAKPTGATRDEIVSRLTLSLKLLDRSAADAKRFHLDFEPARTRLRERLDGVKALVDPRLAYRWDAQSLAQLEILQRAMTGLRAAATQHASMDKQAPAHEEVGAPSPYTLLATPVVELGKGYVEAARVSELAITAQQKLDEADERAKRLPLDFADAQLQILRRTLAHMAIDKLHPEQRYGAADLEAKGYAALSREEMRLRHEVAWAREKFATDPDAALGRLGKLAPDFNKLQLGVQLGGVIERLLELLMGVTGGMTESSGLGAIFTSGDYKVEISRVLRWANRWMHLYNRYRKGEYATADFKQELKDVSSDREWQELFTSVLKRLQDLKQREAWINFGAKIAALVGVALVTAGVGALAEGAGLGFWTVSGIEALTFTTLTLPLEDKPSVEGFFLHLFENWITFGIVKGATALYEAAVGEKFAQTLLGKGTSHLVGFATATSTMIAQAEVESLARQGRSLSAAEIKGIVGESAAITLATILAARYAKPFLGQLRARGEAFRGELDAIDAMRVENQALAETVKDTKSSALAKKLAEADAKVAQPEGELLQKLSRDGVGAKDKDGRPLSPEQRQVVAELTQSKAGQPSPLAAAKAEQAGVARARTLVEMEPAGPDLFLAEPGKDIIGYAERFFKAGAEVTGPETNADGSRSIIVDFKDGHPFEVMTRAPEAVVTRPAEAPAPETERGPAPTAKERAAEAAPEIRAHQERAAEAARDAERAQAELVEQASTGTEPGKRMELIKRAGAKLLDATKRALAPKEAEQAALKKTRERLERKIADWERQKDKARAVDPLRKKTSEQINKEVERLNRKIRKAAAEINEEDPRARQLVSEIGRLNETAGQAKRMIEGKEINTLPCFPPGTPVWTTRGLVPIEELSVATAVECWDEHLGERRVGAITKVHRHRTLWLYRILTTVGSVDSTGDHRFFAEQAGWTAARDLRAGMQLKAQQGSAVVESVSLVEYETATYNLSIDPCPTFFVGPGLLVHNAGGFNLGDLFIYEGYNPDFPDLIYIGQTNDRARREAEHNREGQEGLRQPQLTPEERLFFKFKAGMKLRVRPGLTGLDQLTADYFEQVNKNWEATIRGEGKVMNRYEIVAKKNWAEVARRVTELFCPK